MPQRMPQYVWSNRIRMIRFNSFFQLLCFPFVVHSPLLNSKLRLGLEMAPLVPLNILKRREGKNVNLLGVIVEFSIPRASKGTDYVMSLKLVDESLQEVNVNMFMAVDSDFPVIEAIGDVIYLNKVKVNIFNDQPSVVFKKAVSYFFLYSGSAIGNFKAYAPRRSYELADAINKEIDRLRLWYHNTRLNAGSSNYLISIKDFLENQYFDLVCKVLCIAAEYDEEMRLFYSLYIWDGTDAPIQSINRKFVDEQYNPLPINTDFDLLPRSTLASFPQAGTVLRILVEVGVEDIDDHFNFTNRWVRLRNIKCECSHGMWQVLWTSLKLRLLPDTDEIVQQRDRSYKQRIRENGCLPMFYDPLSNHLTEMCLPSSINYEDSGFVWLLHVVAYPKVDVLFKCVVRVVAFCTSGCLGSMRLTIEDPTTRIHAFMVPSDGGHPTLPEVVNKLKGLLGIPEHENLSESVPRSPPWIQCTLSASLADPSRSDGSRKYLIRYTKMT